MNAYVFERAVTFRQPDGTTAERPDRSLQARLLRAGGQAERPAAPRSQPGQERLSAVAQPKAARQALGTARLGHADVGARGQAEKYAKALPASHGWPPFLLVCDVGHSFELFADFSGQGKNYAQFPDGQGFRIVWTIWQAEIRERLRKIWTDPFALDPTQERAKVTREVAERLAQVQLLKALEASKGHAENGGDLPDALPVHHVRRGRGAFAQRLVSRCSKIVGPIPEFRTAGRGIVASDEHRRVLHTIERRSKVQRQSLRSDAQALSLGREEIGELFGPRDGLERGRAGDFRHAAGTGAEPGRAPQARRPLHAARLCRTAGDRDRHRAAARRMGQGPGAAEANGRGRPEGRARRSKRFTTTSARRASSIRPAAPEISSTSRSSC